MVISGAVARDGAIVLDLRFRTALARMVAAGRFVRVDREVDPHLELAGIMKRYDGDRALLFDRVKGSPMPVIGNVLANPHNVEAAFGCDRHGVRRAMRSALTDPIPPEVVDAAPVQDVVLTSGIELGDLLPALTHAPGDSGRYVTAGVVIVRDLVTGVANASYHRLQLLGGARMTIKLDHGRHLRSAHERAVQLGRDLPVAVVLGADLSLLYAAAFMGSQMPEGADELAAAGGIQGAALRVAPTVTGDLVVPAHAEIVLEARISPTETAHEGPFAEFVGYGSDDGPAPVLTVDAVTTRRDPVYYAINGAGRETVMLRKYVLEASAIAAMQAAVPIVSDVNLTAGGLHRFHAVIQVAKRSALHDGLQRNAVLAAFAALKDLDAIVVVDDDIDIHDGVDVEYAIATRVEASRDVFMIPGARGHEYVRVSDGGLRTKVGIDATVPFEQRDRFRRATFADVGVTPGDLRPVTRPFVS
jgi:2,5-furandicarboxylate decarboxylase 1